MSEKSQKIEFKNRHVEWIACLYVLLVKIRKEGLMSIECHIEDPSGELSVFSSFPGTKASPYLEFAADSLRLLVGGNLNANDVDRYMKTRIRSLCKSPGWGVSPDRSILETIRIAIWASLRGMAPQIACEFARQAIPAKSSPSFQELEDILKTIKTFKSDGSAPKPFDMNESIDDFFASIKKL